MPDCNDVTAPLSAQPSVARLIDCARETGITISTAGARQRGRPVTESAIVLPGKLGLFDWDEGDSTGRIRRSVRPNDKLAYTLDNTLSVDECRTLMAASEASAAFQPAGLGTAGKQEVASSLRNSDRLISEDARLADFLWSRVKDHVPVCFRGRRVIGLNEQLKFLRYGEGQFFKPHFDGSFARPGTQNVTCLTLQFYLSDDVQGGATRFTSPLPKDMVCIREALPPSLRDVECEAVQGRALIFQHDILHEGAPVTGGIKYTIRTDVEYGPVSWMYRLREAVGLGCSPRRMRKRLLVCLAGSALGLLLAHAVALGSM